MTTFLEDRAKLLDKLAAQAVQQVADLTEAICLIPAPSYEEAERARFVAQQFEKRGYQPTIDAIDNVIVRRPGRGGGQTMMIAAHTDTVFPRETRLTVTRDGDTLAGPGIGDNCLAVAALIVLADLLDQADIQTGGDLLLVANVGEEGLGNLRGIRAVVDDYQAELGSVIALEGHALGRVTTQAVGSTRIRVTVTGPGGHSWSAFGRPSAIHALGQIISQISQLCVPAEPKTSYNVGVIEGGVSVNTIAPTASAIIDMRSVDPASLQQLEQRVCDIVAQQNSGEISTSIETLGQRPAGEVSHDHPLVQNVVKVLTFLGMEPKFGASSTDANIPMSRGIAATCLGVSRGANAHRTDEYIHISPIRQGLRQLLHLIELHMKQA